MNFNTQSSTANREYRLPSTPRAHRQLKSRKGKLVGEDEFGNKYFENTAYQSGRHRWVEYADLVRVHLNHLNSRTCTGNQSDAIVFCVFTICVFTG